MKSEQIKLSKIKPNKANPRLIKDDKFYKLVNSILVFHQMLELRPVVVDKDMTILGGNMRYKALIAISEMPIEEVKSRLEKLNDYNLKDDAQKASIVQYWEQWKQEKDIPVVKAETLTEAEKKEFIIKDNASFGEWDWDALANEWDSSDLNDWGIDAWNEENEELDEKEVKEDEYEEPSILEVEVKRGDVWKLGDHRLMCGDSTKIEDMKKLMSDELADLYLTDPPYNVNYEGGTKDKLKILNDTMDDEKFRGFLTDAFLTATEVIKAGASFYIWHSDSEGFNFRYAVKSANWKLRETLIWNKNAMVMGRQDYQWKHEPCLYGWKDGAGHKWYSDRKQTTVIDFNKPNRSELHPTMKPIGLFGYQIKNSTKKVMLSLIVLAEAEQRLLRANNSKDVQDAWS